MSFLNKPVCEMCFTSEDGICSKCAIELGCCLNCISYGNGGLCINCETMGDEGVCFEFDLNQILRWIEFNDDIFENLNFVN